MKIVAIRTDEESGDSYFDEIEIEMKEKEIDSNSIGSLSKFIKGKGIYLRKTPCDYNFDYHNAPCRQFIINLDASVKITTTKHNESKTIKKGQIFYVCDIDGKGHKSESVNSKERNSIFFEIDDDLEF